MTIGEWIVARLKERDTQVVLASAVYMVARAFVPVEYTGLADAVAGMFGVGVAATPLQSGK